jgi:hypothetical protein
LWILWVIWNGEVPVPGLGFDHLLEGNARFDLIVKGSHVHDELDRLVEFILSRCGSAKEDVKIGLKRPGPDGVDNASQRLRVIDTVLTQKGLKAHCARSSYPREVLGEVMPAANCASWGSGFTVRYCLILGSVFDCL